MHTDIHTPSSAPAGAVAFDLSEAAAARINALKAEEGKPGLKFRVGVKGGGCSGFSYEFVLDETPASASDTIVSRDGAEVIIDDVSLNIVRGAVLDYNEDLAHAGFSIKNPNATAKCGCGNSFSVSL